MQVTQFTRANDFRAQARIAALYDGVFDFVPVLHQILVGNGLGELYVCWDTSVPLGALVLKSPEAVMPIGAKYEPLAWVVSDVVTDRQYRRRGIAMTLLRAAEGIVWNRGGRILYLYCDQGNAAARGLYLKAGYRRLLDQGRNIVFVKLREPRER